MMDIGKMIKGNPVRSGLIAVVVLILAIYMFCGGACSGKTDADKKEAAKEVVAEEKGVLSLDALKKGEMLTTLKSATYYLGKWQAAEDELTKVRGEMPAEIKKGIAKALPEATKAKEKALDAALEALRGEQNDLKREKGELAAAKIGFAAEQAALIKGQAALEIDRKAFDAHKEAYWKAVELLKTGVPVPAPEPKLEEKKKEDPPTTSKIKVKGPKKK